MGIDVHALNILRFALKRQAFGKVATIGRQQLHVPDRLMKKLMPAASGYAYGAYCEDLLREHFGAASVDSYDGSAYEGATRIADLNVPLVATGEFDTVFDGGCLEHIYDIRQALENVSLLCALGGQILHVLPANNLCGHGFWQFSPSIFFSLYSQERGYDQTQVFLADLGNTAIWYEVRKPEGAERVSATSASPLYALVRTRLVARRPHAGVQQSDYVHAWARQEPVAAQAVARASAREGIRNAVLGSRLEPLARLVFAMWQLAVPPHTALAGQNPLLKKCVVSELV